MEISATENAKGRRLGHNHKSMCVCVRMCGRVYMHVGLQAPLHACGCDYLHRYSEIHFHIIYS